MDGITEAERLALLVAVNNKITPLLKEAKDEACDRLMEDCAKDGTDRRALVVNGERVGEVGVTWTKPSPVILGGRYDEAVEFLAAHGLTETVPAEGWKEHFACADGRVVFTDTGEVVEWAGWAGQRPKYAAVKGCKPDEVMRAFGARLAGVEVRGLLEGVM